MSDYQELVTKEFRKRVNDLINSSQVADYSEIIKKLEWNKSSMSSVMNGSRNVPLDIWAKFAEVYNVQITPKSNHITTRNHLKEIGDSKRGIMVYESAPVQAGFNTVYHDEHAVPDYVLNIPQFRDCNYGTRASGDSMYPEIRNGDLVVCKELPLNARIMFGDIYIVHTKDGQETIKYINQFENDKKAEEWILAVPHNKAAGTGTPIPRNEIIKLFKVRAIFKAY